MGQIIGNDSIGVRIKTRRLELGMSVKELAKGLGVAESTLRDWENGRKISGEPYVKMATLLKMPLIKLLSASEMRLSDVESEILKLKESVERLEKLILPFC